MACTYDPSLSTNRDWVRFLIGDVDVPDSCIFEDEEIDGMLTEVIGLHGTTEGTKYCAAALAWNAMVAEKFVSGAPFGPLIEKAVGRLRLRRSGGQGLGDPILRYSDYLTERCAFYSTPRPRVFRSVAKTPRRYCGRRTIRGNW